MSRSTTTTNHKGYRRLHFRRKPNARKKEPTPRRAARKDLCCSRTLPLPVAMKKDERESVYGPRPGFKESGDNEHRMVIPCALPSQLSGWQYTGDSSQPERNCHPSRAEKRGIDSKATRSSKPVVRPQQSASCRSRMYCNSLGYSKGEGQAFGSP